MLTLALVLPPGGVRGAGEGGRREVHLPSVEGKALMTKHDPFST